MSDLLPPHELQNDGIPCPSLFPKFPQTHVHWVDDAIQPSHPLLPSVSSWPQSFPASAPFPVSLAVLHQRPKYWSFSFSISLPMNIQDWFPLRLTGLIYLLSKGFSKVISSTTIQKLWCSAFFLVQLSHPYMITGKTIALTIQTFVGKVMSLLFNILSRFVIAFLPRSNCLLILWLQSHSAVISEPKRMKSVTVSIVPPSICM